METKERIVIALTRLNGHPLMVNCDMIEQIEETPDTVVTLNSGNKLIVRDSMRDVQQKIIEFKRRIYGPEG
jgi:flagellar protein FlbD